MGISPIETPAEEADRPDLPAAAPVIRGWGRVDDVFTTDHLAAAAENCAVILGERGDTVRYMISVNSIPDATVEELAVRANLPHAAICPSDVGRLGDVGWAIEMSDNWDDAGHCSVFVEGGDDRPPTLVELLALQKAFDRSLPNPTARPMRKP